MELFLGYQYLKLRASRYPSHRFAAGPSLYRAEGGDGFRYRYSKNNSIVCALEKVHYILGGK